MMRVHFQEVRLKATRRWRGVMKADARKALEEALEPVRENVDPDDTMIRQWFEHVFAAGMLYAAKLCRKRAHRLQDNGAGDCAIIIEREANQ